MEVKLENRQKLQSNDVIAKEDGCYIDPAVFPKILIGQLGWNLSLQDLASYILGLKMTITEEEINAYLDEKLERENKELKNRFEKRKNGEKMKEKDERSILDIWLDEEEISKYILKPYILKSSRIYIDILKEKCLKLLYFVDTLEKVSITKKEGKDLGALKTKWQRVSFELNRYGIEMDENSWLHEQSFIRLMDPLIFNIKTLVSFVERANDKETYYHSDVKKEEIPPLPDEKLQREDLTFSHPGYIALSEAQKDFLRKEQNEEWWQEENRKKEPKKQTYIYARLPQHKEILPKCVT